MNCSPGDHQGTILSNLCFVQVCAPGAHGWYPTFSRSGKGPRVLNRNGIEGSIIALYRHGQGQILHFLNPNIRVYGFSGYEIEENSRNGGEGGRGAARVNIIFYSTGRAAARPLHKPSRRKLQNLTH